MINPKKIHKFAHICWRNNLPKIGEALSRINFLLTSCHIPPRVFVPESTTFKHFGCGVIINHKTQLGENIEIHPHVVIGQSVGPEGPSPLETIIISDNVLIGTGAKIIAKNRFVVAKSTIIGANAVLTKPIHDEGTILVGVPALPLKQGKGSRLRNR